jgi:C-methyltransferase-like protein/putative zinc binding protein/methyltransferase family protein
MTNLTIGTNSSIRIKNCQVCNSSDLQEVLSLGHLPQVNVMQSIGSNLQEEIFFPAELLLCNDCSLVQLSHIVDPKIIFPLSYTYTSRTTKILRENFADLAKEASMILDFKKNDLVADIGSNDGTLLSNFKDICQVLGIEPTDAGHYANEHGIPTIQTFFNMETANNIVKWHDYAKLITAANVFAHIEDVHGIVDAIKTLKSSTGVFISESHYLVGLMQTNQYDTVYHEHLRYYSLTSIKHLLELHGLEVFHAKYIPTHGGSIRVYAADPGIFKIRDSVANILETEQQFFSDNVFEKFKKMVVKSKCELYSLISKLDGTIGAIGAPSRAATLVNYAGLNEDILQFILEAPGSAKIGKYMPGTKIPILEESTELLKSVDNILLLSWHIADEIMPKLRNKGFTGNFIIPLPLPSIK